MIISTCGGRYREAHNHIREGYVADALAVLDHLGLRRVTVLGHSLGGVNAYQLAAAIATVLRPLTSGQ